MNKADLAILERIFSDDIEAAIGNKGGMPTQFKKGNKRVQKLADEGYIEPWSVRLGGRFPVTVTGWKLTMRGHATYCFSCDDDEPVRGRDAP